MIIITPQYSFPSQRGQCYRSCARGLGAGSHCASNEAKATTNNEKPEVAATIQGRVILERAPIHQTETPEAATISLDVTGFTIDNLDIQIEDHIVSISGQRENRLGDTYMIRRRFKVDKKTVDQEQIRANLSDGVLEIIVPKKPQTGPRAIPISADASNTLPATASATSSESSDGSSETPTLPQGEVDPLHDTVADESVEVANASEEGTVEVETVGEDDAAKAKEDTSADEEAWEDVIEEA